MRRSDRSTGRRAAGKPTRTANPSVTRIHVMTGGARASSPMSMRRYEEPHMRATPVSSTHSSHPNGPLWVPTAVEKMGGRPGRPGEYDIGRTRVAFAADAASDECMDEREG